jgi:hypothetical protein
MRNLSLVVALFVLLAVSTSTPGAACECRAANGASCQKKSECAPGVFLVCGDDSCAELKDPAGPAWLVDGVDLKRLDARAAIARLLGKGFGSTPEDLFLLRSVRLPAVDLSAHRLGVLGRSLGGERAGGPAAPLARFLEVRGESGESQPLGEVLKGSGPAGLAGAVASPEAVDLRLQDGLLHEVLDLLGGPVDGSTSSPFP